MHYSKLLLLCIICSAALLPCDLAGQVKLSESFMAELEHSGIEFISPVEGRYKAKAAHRNPYLDYQFAIRSRKEKIEIRYFIDPQDRDDLMSASPHAAVMRMVLSLATNDQDAIISNLSIGEKTLREDFNADWGKMAIFQPKHAFSEYTHCKMLALFKENAGMAYIFFLFDKNSREVDNRFVALRFQEQIPEE